MFSNPAMPLSLSLLMFPSLFCLEQFSFWVNIVFVYSLIFYTYVIVIYLIFQPLCNSCQPLILSLVFYQHLQILIVLSLFMQDVTLLVDHHNDMRLDIEDMSYEASIHGFGVVFPINVDYIL